MKKRTHVSLDHNLHAEAVRYADEAIHTDFSGLVTYLLVEELNKKKLIDSFTSSSSHLATELIRRAAQPPANSPLVKIEKQQQERLEKEADKSRDAGESARSTRRATRATTSRARR